MSKFLDLNIYMFECNNENNSSFTVKFF